MKNTNTDALQLYPRLCAHRGFNTVAPENSLPAFASAIALGAEEIELAKTIRKRTNRFVLFTGAAVMIIMSAASDWYSSVFVSSESVSSLIRSGLVIFTVSFLFSGINTITTFYFSSIGKARESALISSSRGLVILLICIFTLPSLLGMTGVWLVAPVTEAFTIILTLVLIRQNDYGCIFRKIG
jgi:Na+-driven multidrug efflux pump